MPLIVVPVRLSACFAASPSATFALKPDTEGAASIFISETFIPFGPDTLAALITSALPVNS